MWTEPIVRHFLSEKEEVSIYTSHPCIFDHYPSKNLYINQMNKLLPLEEPPISLQLGEMPQMHLLECFRQQAGISDMKLSSPQLHLSVEEKKRIVKNPYVILHLDFYHHSVNFRNVYGIHWKEIISYLQMRGWEVYQISPNNDHLVAPWLPTRNFREVMSLLYHSDLFIGLDSGPSHIASSLQIPSIIFFGSVNPQFRHLDQHKKIFLQSPCPHAHCYHKVPMQFGQPCRLVSDRVAPPCCIQDTSSVIQAIETLKGQQSMAKEACLPEAFSRR
jgi:ADP-heptose:LPS heptosyltransferase